MVALAGPGWRLAPSLVVYVAEIDARFPLRDHISDGSIGDAAHASRESDHNPYEGWVHAVDIDEDVAPGIALVQLWAYLIAKRDPRIRYLIYEGQIVKSYRDSAGHAAWKPYPYTGTNAHEHHLHLSISRTPEARSDVRRWGVEAAFPRTSPPPPQEDDDMTADQASQLNQATLLAIDNQKRLERVELRATDCQNRLTQLDKKLDALLAAVKAQG